MPAPADALAASRLPRGLYRLFPLLLVPFLPGCAGDQFGGENGGGDCIEVSRQTFGVDDVTPIGFRARDVLDFAATTLEIPFTLSVPDDVSGLVLTPEGGSTLELTIASNAEQIVFVDLEEDPTSSAPAQCSDYLEIEAEATLRTDNGGLDDTLPILLQSPQPASAALSVELEAGGMQGTFDLVEDDELSLAYTTPPDGWELDRTVLDLALHPGHAAGRLIAWYEGTYSEEEEPQSAIAVLWSTADGDALACYTEDFGGPVDDGQAISRFQELLSDTPRLSIAFTSGDVADLELEATFAPSPEVCLSPVDVPALSALGELVLSRDGEHFATWPLQAYTLYTTDGEREPIQANAAVFLPQPFDEEDIRTNLGDFDFDFSEYDEAAAVIWLEQNDAGNWEGHFELQGDLQVLAAADVVEMH